MLFHLPETRWHAFAYHILLSAVIFLVLAAIIVFYWYPDFLFVTDGGWQGIRLIAGIDFIIGPTLTLIIYKQGKKGLIFDLTFIAAVQFICLAAGIYTVYQERPISVVFFNGEFHTLSEGAYKLHNISADSIDSLNPMTPSWFYVELPKDKKVRSTLIMNQLVDGPLYLKSEYYSPYSSHLSDVAKANKNQTRYIQGRERFAKIKQECYIYPLVARYFDGYIALNKNNLKTCEIIGAE